MKKKLLGVCFCLLAMASMSMAATTHDSILAFGVGEIEDSFEALANHLGVSSDYVVDSLFTTGINKPLGTNMVSYAPEFEFEGGWDYLVLWSMDTDLWYLFADDYSDNLGDGFADGLLTTPFLGADFNPEGMMFDSALGFVSPAPVPEPGSLLLLGSGIIGLGVVVKRRMNK